MLSVASFTIVTFFVVRFASDFTGRFIIAVSSKSISHGTWEFPLTDRQFFTPFRWIAFSLRVIAFTIASVDTVQSKIATS